MQNKWNGRVYSLDKVVNTHQHSFVQTQDTAEHVNFQLLTEYSRLWFLIDNMSNSDPDLRDDIANVRIITDNMLDDFEGDAGVLIPLCPYARHWNEHGHDTSNRWGANISDATLKGKSSSKTGIDLRWHNCDEYTELSDEQKHELYEWQKSKYGKSSNNQSQQKYKTSKTRYSGHTTRKYLQAKIIALEAKLEKGISKF